MCSAGMPKPVSVTEKCAPSSSVHQRISIEPSGGVYFAALSTRLEKAEWISGSSPSSSAEDSTRTRTSRGCTERASTSLRSSASNAATSTGEPPTISSVSSSRESSIRSRMIAVMRSAWRRISATGAARSGSRAPSCPSASRYPEITVRGERNSCEALATKSRRTASRRICRDIAHQQQQLPLAIRRDLQRQVAVLRVRRTNDHGVGVVLAGEIPDELRLAQQVLDAQLQQPRRHRVEPDYLTLRVENHDTVRERGGRALQLAHELHEALLVEALA